MIRQPFVTISKIKMHLGFQVFVADPSDKKQHCAH